MRLAVQLLGTPQFILDHVPVSARRRAVTALLAYLTASDTERTGRRYSRESLAALLWTDYDSGKALANLRHTLWEVTRFIGEGWVVSEHEMLYLNPGAEIRVDVTRFRASIKQASIQAEPALRLAPLVEAAALYRGDFLSGFNLKDAPAFNEWALTEAESLRREFASALNRLVADYGALGQAQPALPYARRLIALDPMDEAAHRQLMQLYELSDQHAAAVRQYHSLEKLLRKELNIDPQPETRDLYKRIRRGELHAATPGRKAAVEPPAPRHNLPVHLTTFIGREAERDEVGQLLERSRLVTLIGPGGIGKTRLSVQAAERVLDRYPDGAWFVALDSLTDEDLVPQAIALAIGLGAVSEQSPLEDLGQALRSRSLLLILDNCEHLLESCARAAESLLRSCPGLRILSTSRDALRIEGEALYPVPPLSVPPAERSTSLDELAGYPGVRLFTERAALVVPGFQTTRENAAPVARICRLLDGIPLAIELAAARVDLFRVEEILAQLGRSLDLLASDSRSALPRQRTMRASIDWGWNLLSQPEQAFIRGISVFIGGWTLESGKAVTAANVLELTSTLLKKSFVVVHQTDHETRYGLHEIIRAYAREKLVEAGEEGKARDRHLAYFLELGRRLGPELSAADRQLWMERLALEQENLRAALEWAARTDVQAGLYLSKRLRLFWEHSQAREDARWLLMI